MDILTDTNMMDTNASCIPLEQHHVLLSDTSTPYLTDVTPYRRLVGRLIYLTITRPDLSYLVHVLAQFMYAPRESHWSAEIKVVKYLKGTCGPCLFFSSDASLDITAYCDADWASCPSSRLSLTGYCVLIGDALVTWKCKK